MAADQVLLEACTPETLPTLRLYSWQQPTLSIGRNEALDDLLDPQRLQQLGIPVIRRTTGGKAVLHGFDLTYSVSGAVLHPEFAGGVLDNYRFLAQGFLRFFQALGLQPELQGERLSKDSDAHICFTDPAAYEILVDGRKLIGNAQRVRSVRTEAGPQRVFLQHGSLPLTDSVPLLHQIFPHASEAQLREEMHSLETCGGLRMHPEASIRGLLLSSLAEAFAVQWERRPWDSDELAQIQKQESAFPELKAA